MARGRIIDKEFWTSGGFYSKGITGRWWVPVLVGAMLSNTDDDGCIRADVSRLRKLFLARPNHRQMPSVTDVEKALDALVLSEMLEITTRGGTKLFRFKRFRDFQHLKTKTRSDAGGKHRRRSKKAPSVRRENMTGQTDPDLPTEAEVEMMDPWQQRVYDAIRARRKANNGA
jgi:hypothetical protein